MIETAIIILTTLVLLFVLEPFFAGGRLSDRFIITKERNADEAIEKHTILLDEMGELESEHAAGKITSEAFEKLYSVYLKQKNSMRSGVKSNYVSLEDITDLNAKIEQDIRILRESLYEIGDSQSIICIECTTVNNSGSNFCSHCGSKLG